ncbi:MAG: hypothetical protein PUP92_07110 [Rhizonema sp. PD38]|nr:hypothetical protein [Rhizonema sp. PD38]
MQILVNQTDIPADIGKLYDIAISYPPLAESYKQVQELLDGMAEYRSKGVDTIPQFEPEKRNTEIENVSVEIKPALVEFEKKIDHNKLTEFARQITKARNSVQSAKDIIKTIFF